MTSDQEQLQALITEFHTGLIDAETFVQRAGELDVTDEQIQEAVDAA
jgi:hypothetical protein